MRDLEKGKRGIWRHKYGGGERGEREGCSERIGERERERVC